MPSRGSNFGAPTPEQVEEKMKTNFRRALALLLIVLSLTACSSEQISPTPTYPGDPTGFFPNLIDPPGAHRPGGGGGENPEKRGMAFDLITELPIGEVQDFYAAQLDETGWKRVVYAEETGKITSYWEIVDENGKAWPARLETSNEPISDQANYMVSLLAVSPP